VAKKKKKIKFIIIFLVFILYFFIAARPVQRETILSPKWINSLEIEGFTNGDIILPFVLGSNFGYIDSSGHFALNKIITGKVYLSRNMWTEYDSEPENIIINNIQNGTAVNIDNPGGYPVLLDNRIFILGSDQNSLSEIGTGGRVVWAYESGAPLTCIDAAADLVVTGSLDGAVEVFDSSGERIFYFEPDGSRYSIILGVAMSRNGSRIGIICGIDQQRFLLLERHGNTGGDYKVIYHEYLGSGFRRPVRILFVDDDQRVVYERTGGIGSYNIRSRHGIFIPLEGEIAAIDELGDNGFLFLVTSHADDLKKLVGIRFPPDRLFGVSRINAERTIFMKASFRSADVFLGRTRINNSGSALVVGGGTRLISFELEEN